MTEDEKQLQMEGTCSSPSKFIYTQSYYDTEYQTNLRMRTPSSQISPKTTRSPWATSCTPQNAFNVFSVREPKLKRESASELRDTPMMTPDFPSHPLSREATPRAQVPTETRYTLPTLHNNCPLHAHPRSLSGSTISFATDSVDDYQISLFQMLEDVCTTAAKWHWNRTASRLSLSDLGDCRHRARGTNFPYPLRRARELRFMDYVSRIANLLWERARRDVITPRRAEMEAVEGMARLYKWAERVVRAWEGRDEAILAPEEVGVVVLAARDLCSWLGYEEGRIRCEEIYRGWGVTVSGEVE